VSNALRISVFVFVVDESNESDISWDEHYRQLTAYKQAHGNCNVSKPRKLGRWRNKQQANFKNNKLSPDRIKRLEDLSFVWDPLEVAWEEMFTQLTVYKQAHGDCNVSKHSKDNHKLGTWCSSQRENYYKNKIPADRLKRLEDLGFVWDRHEFTWEEMFVELTAHKQAHGDCNVPFHWKDNPKLARWCSSQRRIHKNNKLSPDRVKRLADLGFRFVVRELKKK